MTRILALDCSTWWGGAALLERTDAEVRLVAEIGVAVSDSHASHLIGWLDRLLATAGWSRGQLDGFAATRGPGSFTGIRVALGTVEGLALASDRRATGVVTLDALVEAHGPAAAPRRGLIWAGRGEYYTAVYDAAGSPPTACGPVGLISGEALAECADGAEVRWVPAAGSRSSLAALPPQRIGTRLAAEPRSIAAAAGRIALQTAPGPAEPLTPLYVRPPDAELHRRSRR